MEIPYTVTARPDTGLWNAKIGIWLFLASEVMLFGGLFSSYVFLRLGADYPWPVHELDVLPGFINTFVLILSSVTVVFAWAFLKMRQYRNYQLCMAATLLCALAFLAIKSYEYTHKFTHWAVQLSDGSVLDGHNPEQKIEFGDVTAVTLNLREGEEGFMKFAEDGGASKFKTPTGDIVESISRSLIHAFRDRAIEQRRSINRRIDDLKAEIAKAPESGKPALKKQLDAAQQEAGAVPTSLRLTVEGKPLHFKADRSKVRNYLGNELTFRDGTKLEGKLINDDLTLEVSGYDLRQMKGLSDNLDAADTAKVWAYLGDYKHGFMEEKEKALAEFKEKYPDRTPQQYGEVMRKAFKGEHLGHDPKEHAHVKATVKASEVKFFSNYSPHLNTYYAIYFLMTGLHGLHVIGGGLVLGHFFFFGRKIYEKNPEHLANRVEVGGLFWHFVDLVWIFLFPIFYLL